MVWVAISASLMVTDAVAMDKRTFVFIVPPGTNAFHLIVADTRITSHQYKPNGQLQMKVKNKSLMTKAIARFSLLKNLELAFEVPYLLDRNQKRTNAAGISETKFDSNGLGDADLQLTWQWRDARKGGLGLLTGIELKFPTGDKDEGLGSETWDMTYRSVLSYKTVLGYPYGMAIFTDVGSKTVNGIKTNHGDDLFLAAGFKSHFWHGFGFDFLAYRYIMTSRPVSVQNGSKAITEKHDTPGWRAYLRYRINKALEWNLFCERGYPKDHEMYVNGTVISKEPGTKKRIGTMIKYFW